MYNNNVTLLVNIVDITTMYCAYETMYIIHIIYIAMYITLYCAYEYMCTLPCIYLIAVVLVKGYI